jgi:hypothetical protein
MSDEAQRVIDAVSAEALELIHGWQTPEPLHRADRADEPAREDPGGAALHRRPGCECPHPAWPDLRLATGPLGAPANAKRDQFGWEDPMPWPVRGGRVVTSTGPAAP